MSNDDIDLPAEVARVGAELAFFRRECLPALLGRPISECVPESVSDALRERIIATVGTISSWQRAATQLADGLPFGHPLDEAYGPSRGNFRDFLIQYDARSFSFREGRIVWQINTWFDLATPFHFCSGPGEITEPWSDISVFRARQHDARRWLLALPIDDCRLYNALGMVLPTMADIDPAFAKLALDPATWRALIQADDNLTPEQRARRLRLIDGHFGYILNNALLHVLGALANNHFLLIGDYLDHPHVRGRYTHLMPRYLFTVLFEKVLILRQFARLPEVDC